VVVDAWVGRVQPSLAVAVVFTDTSQATEILRMETINLFNKNKNNKNFNIGLFDVFILTPGSKKKKKT
jgi:hypothetical protein